MIDHTWVQRHADRYLDDFDGPTRELEDRLFAEVGPAAVKRGWLERKDLLQIARWKANRSIGRVKTNNDEYVRRVTEVALKAPDERALTLTSLFGVGIPMASAILAVCFPERYTVFDVNAVWALRQHGEIPNRRVDYGLYLSACRELANRLGPFKGHVSDLRALDRALWKYAQQNMKKRQGGRLG